MLKLNKLTDYAIVILTHLAKGENQFYTTTKIVQFTKLPQPTVAKLMKQLSNLRLVCANRGPQGGYKLNIDPKNTTIADIIKAFEGPVSFTNCENNTNSACMVKQCCNLGPIWNKINHELMAVLDKYTIESFNQYEELRHFMNLTNDKKEHSSYV